MKCNQSDYISAKSKNSNQTGLNAAVNHSINTSHQESLLKFVDFHLGSCAGDNLVYLLDLWGCLSSSASNVGEDLSHLLHLLEDLPGHAQDLVATGGNLVKSLTCDDLVFSSPYSDHVVPSEAGAPVDPPPMEV
ncbi:hypothetical protein DSO57_1038974 [Entomophthora muscae]|uniref:Uncharacterized protein n=1 Tax=Entomophthora muscae TaxID=34485 RepID=A0ACC2RDA9_9FUNG|nr:hypothetical protein DSO57_1038974 [Entomophthora muscae]